MTAKTPPKNLSRDSRKLWLQLNREWELDTQALMVLRVGLEAYDQLKEARALIDLEGAIIETPTHFFKEHPALKVEREARAGFLQAWRMLAFNVEPPIDINRQR